MEIKSPVMSPLTKKIKRNTAQCFSEAPASLKLWSTNKALTPSQTAGAPSSSSSLSFEMLLLGGRLYETRPQTTTDAEWAAKCEAAPLQYFKGEVHREARGGWGGVGWGGSQPLTNFFSSVCTLWFYPSAPLGSFAPFMWLSLDPNACVRLTSYQMSHPSHSWTEDQRWPVLLSKHR